MRASERKVVVMLHHVTLQVARGLDVLESKALRVFFCWVRRGEKGRLGWVG